MSQLANFKAETFWSGQSVVVISLLGFEVGAARAARRYVYAQPLGKYFG